MDTLNKVLAATRAKDWRLSFVPFVMGGVYLWIWWFELPISGRLLWLTFLSLTTTVGFASLGYFINEYFDKAYDARAGKLNKLAFISLAYQFGIFFGTILFTFLPWIWLPLDAVAVFLIIVELLLFLVYSLPVPRWKEHTYFSIFIDSAYAYVVPLLLSFHTFSLIAGEYIWPLWLLCFIAGVFFMGVRNMVAHQADDAIKDQRAGWITLPNQIGIAGTKRLVITVLLYEVFFMMLFGALIGSDRPVMLVWLFFFLLAALKVLWALSTNQTSIHATLVNYNYQYLFPLFVLWLISLQDLPWCFVLLGHILFLVPGHLLARLYQLINTARSIFLRFLLVDFRHAMSMTVNVPVYCLFLLFGVDLKAENKSALGYWRSRRKNKMTD
jgi:hypothetical protein